MRFRSMVALFVTGMGSVAGFGCGSSDVLASRELLLVEAGFRTDEPAYAQAPAGVFPTATIRVSLDNRFGRTLLPVPCTADAPEWSLERLNGDRWEVAATAACDLVQWIPEPITPGMEYRAVVRLGGRVQPGTFRLVFGLMEETDDAVTPVLDGRSRSNPFTLAD